MQLTHQLLNLAASTLIVQLRLCLCGKARKEELTAALAAERQKTATLQTQLKVLKESVDRLNKAVTFKYAAQMKYPPGYANDC